jgi:hypothetical protein
MVARRRCIVGERDAMKTVTSFPRPVQDIENVFIRLSDGSRLAARIWIPEDAESSAVPTIVEYISYRKGDRMRDRDEPMHRYIAGHGCAAVRIDVGGTGDSDGVLLDEYLPREIDQTEELSGVVEPTDPEQYAAPHDGGIAAVFALPEHIRAPHRTT